MPTSRSNTVAAAPRISSNVRFADVAHQTLIFEKSDPAAALVLQLIDTPWVQRLRRIKQTGYTNLVYMFSEHSRFGHSLGVAYLSLLLMKNLKRTCSSQVEEFEHAIAAAALLHDIGHCAPGSHLAERAWSFDSHPSHEDITADVVAHDERISGMLRNSEVPELLETTIRVLQCDSTLPPWTTAILSGGGWNTDRGNWAIVDSAMACVSYGNYNVSALIDAFRLTDDGQLVLQESRIDALTHFFVSRDAMYRQVYQHRVLQSVDALVSGIVERLRELTISIRTDEEVSTTFEALNICADETMRRAVVPEIVGGTLPLETFFQMDEDWWGYHLNRWCSCNDPVLSDLSERLVTRRLFKTIRLDSEGFTRETIVDHPLVTQAAAAATAAGYDPKYYVKVVRHADAHRGKTETPPRVLLDSGEIASVTAVDPTIERLFDPSEQSKFWLAVPKSIKASLGVRR